jgi:hypothetical protein
MSKKIPLSLFLLILASANSVLAQSYLFYLEVQGIAGYSSARDKLIFCSQDQMEVMQKPSLGFDYVQRFSKSSGDFAVLAIQARLALNAEGEKTLEPQIYNAYFKYKAPIADLWIGHNRPAFGLSSFFDTHAALLQTLTMNGYGFDRDWGIGLYRDFSRGNLAVSLTTGSGMPLYLKGNYLLSGRISYGVLNQDNYNVGLSVAYGKTLDTTGYHLLSPDPRLFEMFGLDLSYFWNNIENRFEVQVGKKSGENALALYWRASLNLLEEGRLKLEAQPVVLREADKTRFDFQAGLSCLATKDLTLSAMYAYDLDKHDSRIVFQVYFYRRILFWKMRNPK